MEMASQLVYYKQRWEKAEQECKTLKKERRQMESFRGLSNNTSDVLQRNIRQINTLKERLDDRSDLVRYLSIGNVQDEASNAQQILSHFQTIKDQLPTVLSLDSTYMPSIKQLYRESDDLDGLLSTIFDIDVQGALEKTLDTLPALTLYELIQAFTGAAIHCWIFGSEFYTHSMTVTPLLQEYRRHIATLCTY
jgi:hypothetical protein